MHVKTKSEDIDDAGKSSTLMKEDNDMDESKSNIITDNIKSVIYGGLDGIITTFAVVAGVQGADLSAQVILALGFGNLLADAISMGAGDYLSDKAEYDLATMQSKSIESSMKDNDTPTEEQKTRLATSYSENYTNLTQEDAINMVNILSSDTKLFLDSYLRECLGNEPADDDSSPAISGLVTMISFIIFGFVPLIAYVIYQIGGLSNENNQSTEFIICIVLTLLTMGALGALKGKVTDGNMIKSALFVAVNGAVAAAASYLVSWAVAEIVGIRE